MRPYGVLIAAPSAWGPGEVDGAATGACGECKVEVHLAPSSQKLLADRPSVLVLCVPCASRHAGDGWSPQVAVAPGQVPELVEALYRRRAN